MSDDIWRDAARNLRSSQAAAPLRKYLEVEYDKLKEQLVSENTDRLAGRAQQLRKLLKDLFDQDVDTQQ